MRISEAFLVGFILTVGAAVLFAVAAVAGGWQI